MTNSIRLTFLVCIFLATGALLAGQGPPPTQFNDAGLGFRYTPPADMRDFTSVDRQSVQQKAAARGTTNTLTILLSLRSKSDDTAADWHSVGIETYPRQKVGAVSDRDASQTFSRWVAGNGKAVGVPSDVTIGQFHFLISTFELQEGQLVKHARIYTTVCDGRMLSLAFSANSSDVLNSIVASMKTFEPMEHK
jgi:hypothetical protein